MKTIRIWLLLLLVVLVPLRGAAAAAMLCPMAGSGSGEMQLHDHSSRHHHAHEQASAAGIHEHAAHAVHHDHGQTSDSDQRCHLCAAFCSAAPLASTLPALVLALDLSDVAFPSLDAPAPRFVSGGPERPPRTI